jgi:hypothetical protein
VVRVGAVVIGKRAKRVLRSLALSQGRLRGGRAARPGHSAGKERPPQDDNGRRQIEVGFRPKVRGTFGSGGVAETLIN